MVHPIQGSGLPCCICGAIVIGLGCWLAPDADASSVGILMVDSQYGTPAMGGWVGENSSRASGRSPASHVEGGLQLQWGRMRYSEALPAGVWNPSRALTSQADLDWGGSRLDLTGFIGSTMFRYGVAAQYQQSQQGLEQWWDGNLLYQKNQLEFQTIQFEGSLGWLWDYHQMSGQLMAEAVGRKEDQRRSYAVGQSPFSVERIRTFWAGIKGDANLSIADGVALTAGGAWDYSPWSQMTNTVFVQSADSVFQGTQGTRWQAWVGIQAEGRYALGPFHIALVVGLSEMSLKGDISGRTVVDASTGNQTVAYWPENKHREYGVGMTLTWSPGQ